MKEKWVQINQIQGYEDVREWYYLSNSDEDKIVNRSTGKQLKLRFDKNGYKIVCLRTIDSKHKTCYLHVLKARAFIYSPNPLGYNVVRHLNDVKTDNRLINLAWGTQSDNMRDCVKNGNFNYEAAAKSGKKTATKNLIKNAAKNGAKNGAKTGSKNGKKGAKKLSKPVKCLETGEIYPSAKEAERQTGIHNGSINRCCNGRYKTAGKYHWEFVDKEE